jgi:hypothetical protein
VKLISLRWAGSAHLFVHTSLLLMLSLTVKSKILFVPFMIRRCFRIYSLSMPVVFFVAMFDLPQATISPGHFAAWKLDGPDQRERRYSGYG